MNTDNYPQINSDAIGVYIFTTTNKFEKRYLFKYDDVTIHDLVHGPYSSLNDEE